MWGPRFMGPYSAEQPEHSQNPTLQNSTLRHQCWRYKFSILLLKPQVSVTQG